MGDGNWLGGLPKDVAARVRRHTTVLVNGRRGPNGDWWLRRSPTTGMARNAVLFRRDAGGRVVQELPVMVAGVPVPPFDHGGGIAPAP